MIGKYRKFHTQEYIEKYCKDKGCKLLSTYTGYSQKIEFQCYCGEICIKLFKGFVGWPHCFSCGKKIQRKALQRGRDKVRRLDTEQSKKEIRIAKNTCTILQKWFKFPIEEHRTSTIKKYGYGSKELHEHIKNHPNYKNITDKVSIDHVFPFSAFFEHDIWDEKIINHLSNLQPVTREYNCSKGKKYSKEEFYKWLESIGYDNYTKKVL